MLWGHVLAPRHQHDVHVGHVFTKHQAVHAFWLEYALDSRGGGAEGGTQGRELGRGHVRQARGMAAQVHHDPTGHPRGRVWTDAPVLVLGVPAAWRYGVDKLADPARWCLHGTLPPLIWRWFGYLAYSPGASWRPGRRRFACASSGARCIRPWRARGSAGHPGSAGWRARRRRWP